MMVSQILTKTSVYVFAWKTLQIRKRADIFVSCDELYQYLEEAETIAKIAESTKPERNPRLKKRRRTQTSEEQLDDRDEDAYAEDEEHVSKRRDLDDASYKESPSECT
jgi:hypothetical protein